jgi:hypothetical protein
MELNYFEFGIADFGFKKSKIIHMLSSVLRRLTSLYFGA